MRLKYRPEDFVVKERPDGFEPGEHGDFGIYELTKRKLTTLQAIGILSREFGVERRDIDFAGLKDRQSVSKQLISIPGGRRDYHSADLSLKFLGRTDEPVSSSINQANEFSIVVRDCKPKDLEVLEANVAQVRELGLPNYFDDQRFACVRFGQGFVARDMMAGRFEQALRTLIATPLPSDNKEDRDLKHYIGRRWGHWDELAERISDKQKFSAVLQHLYEQPTDFPGALIRMGTAVKTIHLFAWQSMIWNQMVSRWLGRMLPPDDIDVIPTAVGRMTVWQRLADATMRDRLLEPGFSVPLIDSNTKIADGRLAKALNDVLRDEKLKVSQVKIPAEGIFFREEPRELVVRPGGLWVSDWQRDEIFRHRYKIKFRFTLPRGAYGSLVVRRLFLGAPAASGLRAPSAGDGHKYATGTGGGGRGGPRGNKGGPRGGKGGFARGGKPGAGKFGGKGRGGDRDRDRDSRGGSRRDDRRSDNRPGKRDDDRGGARRDDRRSDTRQGKRDDHRGGGKRDDRRSDSRQGTRDDHRGGRRDDRRSDSRHGKRDDQPRGGKGRHGHDKSRSGGGKGKPWSGQRRDQRGSGSKPHRGGGGKGTEKRDPRPAHASNEPPKASKPSTPPPSKPEPAPAPARREESKPDKPASRHAWGNVRVRRDND